MITDVARDPLHNGRQLKKAGRFQCRELVSPFSISRILNSWKVMLHVKEISSECESQ